MCERPVVDARDRGPGSGSLYRRRRASRPISAGPTNPVIWRRTTSGQVDEPRPTAEHGDRESRVGGRTGRRCAVARYPQAVRAGWGLEWMLVPVLAPGPGLPSARPQSESRRPPSPGRRGSRRHRGAEGRRAGGMGTADAPVAARLPDTAVRPLSLPGRRPAVACVLLRTPSGARRGRDVGADRRRPARGRPREDTIGDPAAPSATKNRFSGVLPVFLSLGFTEIGRLSEDARSSAPTETRRPPAAHRPAGRARRARGGHNIRRGCLPAPIRRSRERSPLLYFRPNGSRRSSEEARHDRCNIHSRRQDRRG